MVLNFSGTEYINSTGIALIVGLLARARADGVECSACGLTDHYREIFEITRLADFMTITDNEDSAVGGAEGRRRCLRQRPRFEVREARDGAASSTSRATSPPAARTC